MRRFIQLLWIAAVVCLGSACSTVPEHRLVIDEIKSKNVPPPLVDKISKRQPLRLSDLEELSSRGVSDETIIDYLRLTRVAYVLTVEDIDRLRKSRVSEKVINYLLSTRTAPQHRYYRSYYPYYYYHFGYPYYFHYFHHHHHPRSGGSMPAPRVPPSPGIRPIQRPPIHPQ